MRFDSAAPMMHFTPTIFMTLSFFSITLSQAITTTILTPSNLIPACSADQTVYKFQYTLDTQAFTQMSSKTISVRLEFPSEYRVAANISSMPLQWNGISTSYQTINTSNPILSFSVAPYNFQLSNNLTIFGSNCLFTPFSVGSFPLQTVFSWIGGGSISTNATIQTSAPIFKVVSSLDVPVTNTNSCIDINVITTCSYFSPTATFQLSDPRSVLSMPSIVKVNGVPLSSVTASPSTITVSGLGSKLVIGNSSFKINICSIPTPRFLGSLCGIQVSLGSGLDAIGTTQLCLLTSTPSSFKSVKLDSSTFSTLQDHELSIQVLAGIDVLSSDILEVRLAPDFGLGRIC